MTLGFAAISLMKLMSQSPENNRYSVCFELFFFFHRLFSGCKGETEDQSRRNPNCCSWEKEADWSGREGSGQKRQRTGCHCQTTSRGWELQGGNNSTGQKVCTNIQFEIRFYKLSYIILSLILVGFEHNNQFLIFSGYFWKSVKVLHNNSEKVDRSITLNHQCA